MESKDDSILKSVYCNYRGRVTVYDVHGQKVHELSGMLDYDKYLEIERRTDPEITQFEGLEDYRCIACELKKKKSDSEAELNHSPLVSPLTNAIPRIIGSGTTNSGYNPAAVTNSGYTSPLPRMARVAPRVAPIVNSPLPFPHAGPNSVVNNNSSGVIAKPNCFPSPPPLKKGSYYYNTTECKLYYCDGNSWIFVGASSEQSEQDNNSNPLPEKTEEPIKNYKDERIKKRWWKRIFK